MTRPGSSTNGWSNRQDGKTLPNCFTGDSPSLQPWRRRRASGLRLPADRTSDSPHIAAGVAQLAIAHAPELVFQRHDHFGPGINGLLPGSIRIGHIEVERAAG